MWSSARIITIAKSIVCPAGTSRSLIRLKLYCLIQSRDTCSDLVSGVHFIYQGICLASTSVNNGCGLLSMAKGYGKEPDSILWRSFPEQFSRHCVTKHFPQIDGDFSLLASPSPTLKSSQILVNTTLQGTALKSRHSPNTVQMVAYTGVDSCQICPGSNLSQVKSMPE